MKYTFNPEHTFLAIDTETTGFPRSGEYAQDGQARVCQLGMSLFTGDNKTIMEVSFFLRPDNWSISEGAFKVHGFTDEYCQAKGVHQKSMMAIYRHLSKKADLIIAHNKMFDARMMEIEEYHYDKIPHMELKPWFCTQQENYNLKPQGRGPSLAYAYKHFTGNELDGAHDALVDAKACRSIFMAMHGVKSE